MLRLSVLAAVLAFVCVLIAACERSQKSFPSTPCVLSAESVSRTGSPAVAERRWTRSPSSCRSSSSSSRKSTWHGPGVACVWRSVRLTASVFVAVSRPAASLWVEVAVAWPTTRVPAVVKRLITMLVSTVPYTRLAALADCAVGAAWLPAARAAAAAIRHESRARHANGVHERLIVYPLRIASDALAVSRASGRETSGDREAQAVPKTLP